MDKKPRTIKNSSIDHPGRLLRSALQRGQAIHTKRCKEFDLTTMQSSALGALNQSGPSTQRALSCAIDMELSNLNGLIKRLLDKKLIHQNPDPKDARSKIISLTKKGGRIAAKLIPLSTDVADELLAPLTKADAKIFMQLLEKIAHP
jgi:DNA-binding MarR family transcriptional regulator